MNAFIASEICTKINAVTGSKYERVYPEMFAAAGKGVTAVGYVHSKTIKNVVLMLGFPTKPDEVKSPELVGAWTLN